MQIRKLDDRFYILTIGEILRVKGKKYSEEFAITYNFVQRLYYVTHILSGVSFGRGYETLEECEKNADDLIEIANGLIKKSPTKFERYIKALNLSIQKRTNISKEVTIFSI